MKRNTTQPQVSSHERALAYLKGEMGEQERKEFEDACAQSEELRAELEHTRQLLDRLEASSEDTVARIVNTIIQHAIQEKASDIHLVPESARWRLYYRKDGQLVEAEDAHLRQVSEMSSLDLYTAIIDRWKTMAECNLTERQLPQDGRIAVRFDGKDYDLRVCFLPVLHGERATVRIIDRSNVLIGLDRLGLEPAPMEALKRMSHLPRGFVLTSGMVDCGRTTLLYSLLKDLHESSPGRNILTIEHPVEYRLDGLSQVSVNTRLGLTYAAGLRSIFRSDPDVVMIAELRNLEVAELAIELALTGHLVFSLVHVPSAVQIPRRLEEMGVVRFLIAQTLGGMIAQRLVRRVCPECVIEYTPSDAELNFAGLTQKDGPFRRGAGCESCRRSGFKGRTGLFEVLEITDDLRARIAEGASPELLWQETFGQNGGSLRDDARAKVRQGVTTVEEVNRILHDYPFPAKS